MLMWIILSSAFVAVFLLVRALFSNKIKATAMYGLWILVAIRLLIPTYIPVELDLFENIKLPTITTQIATIDKNMHPAINDIELFDETTNDTMKDEVQAPVANDTITDVVTPTVPSDSITPNETVFSIHPIICIWLIGMIAFGCYFIISNIRFHRALIKKRKLLEQYHYKIPVYYAEGLHSPCMTGIINPGIYINERITGQEEDKYVLDHEFMHYKHKDNIWMLIQVICLCVHWYNPLVWIASALFRRDCECACDESLTKSLSYEDRVFYGKTLLQFAEEKWNMNSIISTSTSMSMEGKTMKKRVHVILDHPPKRVLNSVIAIALAIVLFAGALVANTSEEGITGSNEDNWNATYVLDGTNMYWSFYPDGTFEIIEKGSYFFVEKKNEKTISFYYDDRDEASFVIKEAKNGTIHLIPEINYYLDKEFTPDETVVPLEDVTSEYTFVEGTNGLTSYQNFNGIYHKTNIERKAGKVGYEFKENGIFIDFIHNKYKVLNNLEIKIGNTVYQCLIENDGDILNLWIEDAEETLRFTKVGPAQNDIASPQPSTDDVVYTLSLRSVGRNAEEIASNQITVPSGDYVLALSEQISDNVVNGRVEGDLIEGGIQNAILDIDYPFEQTQRDGTTVVAFEYIMNDVQSGDIITVTITEELQERLGLSDDQIVINCIGYDSKIIGVWEKTSQAVAIGDVPAEYESDEGETVTFETIDTFEFREDKTGKWTTTFDEQHSNLNGSIDFTYVLEGDQLTLNYDKSNTTIVFTISFSGEQLLLDGRNVVFDLNRID